MYQVLKNLKNVRYKTEITKNGTIRYIKLEEAKC